MSNGPLSFKNQQKLICVWFRTWRSTSWKSTLALSTRAISAPSKQSPTACCSDTRKAVSKSKISTRNIYFLYNCTNVAQCPFLRHALIPLVRLWEIMLIIPFFILLPMLFRLFFLFTQICPCGHHRRKGDWNLKIYTPDFQCKQCDFKAVTKSKVSYHRKTIHRHAVFPCDLCEVVLKTRQHLKRHKESF